MSASNVYTQDELLAELTKRFGTDPKVWAFRCPACGDVATTADFRAALDAADHPEEPASNQLGQKCIGRIMGALEKRPRGALYKGRGCDWVAYGLFQGPDFVLMPDGKRAPMFPIAPAPTDPPEPKYRRKP